MRTMPSIRPCRPTDEPSWLQCRLLSLFHTDYNDDAKVAKTALLAALDLRPPTIAANRRRNERCNSGKRSQATHRVLLWRSLR